MLKIKFLDTGEELEVTEASMLANTKVRVSSPEESAQFQKACFDLGITWGWGAELWKLEAKFLFVSVILEGQLEFTQDEELFESYRIREFMFLPSQPSEPLTTPDNEPVSQPSADPGQEITPEALEAEGWEIDYEDHGSKDYSNGLVKVLFVCGLLSEIKIGEQNIFLGGVSTMPDLRTLDRLVNGVTIPS